MDTKSNYLSLLIAPLPVVTAVLPIALHSSYLECACFGFHAEKVEGGSVSPSYAPERSASLPDSSHHTSNYLFNVTA